MSNTISSWFIPFWYSAASGASTTPEMINKKREELKAKNELPSFPNPKSLTPAKATASGIGIFGILLAVYGLFKDNSWGKVLGIGSIIFGAVGWFVDKVLVKADVKSEPQNKKNNPVKSELEIKIDSLLEKIESPTEKHDLLYYQANHEVKNRLVEIGEAATDYLIGKLSNNDGHQQTKLRLIRALELIKSNKAVQPLIGYLNDPDSTIQEAAAHTLGEIGDKEAVDPLIALLKKDKNPYSVTDGYVAEALGKIGDNKAVEPLINVLSLSNGAHTISHTAKALGKLRDKKAVENLISRLSDENEYIVMESIIALGEIGDPRAVNSLIEILKNNSDPCCRYHAGEALGKIGDDRVIPHLISSLSDNEHFGFLVAQTGVIQGLIKFGTKAVEPLINSLSSSNKIVQRGAIYTLGQIGDFGAVDSLIEKLNDTDEYVVRDAVYALGYIGDPKALSAIEQLSTKRFPSDYIRRSCIEAISRIKQKIKT